MRKARTGTSSREAVRSSGRKRLNVSQKTKQLYQQRDKRLDDDPDAPALPPEAWQNAIIGKYYRPLKTQVSVRIDNDVLQWLKASGRGHLTRINDILRDHMKREIRPL